MSHRHRGEKKRIINGDLVYQSTIDKIQREMKSQMKMRLFNGIWSYLATLIIGFMPFAVDFIENAIFWDIVAIFILYGLAMLWESLQTPRCIQRGCRQLNGLLGVLIAIIFALLAIVFAILYDHELRIGNLEYGYDVLATGLKDVDDRVTKLTEWTDTEFYEPWRKNSKWVEGFDTFLVNTLTAMGISRAKLRHGCFMQGTMIQIDKKGNTKAIEEFENGDTVYNPLLDAELPILWIYGNETGVMYQFTTSDGFSVNVTRTHPMLLCGDHRCEYNVAAKDVHEWSVKHNSTVDMMTQNGRKQVVDIQQIDVNDVAVYNLWLQMPDDMPVTLSGIVANGIVTLDFEAQRQHETA